MLQSLRRLCEFTRADFLDGSRLFAGEFRLMAPGLLLDHSKDNEANQQEADPDDRAEMTSRLSGVVHRLPMLFPLQFLVIPTLPQEGDGKYSVAEFLLRGPRNIWCEGFTPEQTGKLSLFCLRMRVLLTALMGSHSLLVRFWCWRLGLKSTERFTTHIRSHRGCRQQSWVASSQGRSRSNR